MSAAEDRKAAPAATTVILPVLPDGWQTLAYAVLADGRLAITGVNADLRHEWRRDDKGRVLGNPNEVAAQATARIWTFDGQRLEAGPSFALKTPFPVVDRFPDGRWLVAGVRGGEGRILSAEGSELRRLRLGDGIMHLKIDETSAIWVGWFDEGVFGNEGWSVPDLDGPPSNYGLAAFDDAGALVRAVHPTPKGSEIADCYALNVVGEAAWACTYTEFPISRSQVAAPSVWWSNTMSGARALAVDLPHVLLAGGYSVEGDRLVLGKLGPDAFEQLDEWRLPLGGGFPEEVEFVDARGDRLHVIMDGVWHMWTVRQFLGWP